MSKVNFHVVQYQQQYSQNSSKYHYILYRALHANSIYFVTALIKSMHKLIHSITEDEDELRFVYTLACASMGEGEYHILELDDSALPAMEKCDM